MTETSEHRQRKLRFFSRPFLLITTVATFVTLTLFPLLSEGTSFHERVSPLVKYVLLGTWIGWTSAKWIIWIWRRAEKTGRDCDKPWFLGVVFLYVLPCVPICYLFMRLFEYPGDWREIFLIFSLKTLISSSILSTLSVAISALYMLVLAHYIRGTNFIFSGTKVKSTRFWQVVVVTVLLLSLPLFAFLITGSWIDQ